MVCSGIPLLTPPHTNTAQIIFAVLEHRLSYPPPKWRNVYKALVVIEYLVKRGSDDCLRLGTDVALVGRIRSLSSFQFIDPEDSRDYGINVRKKYVRGVGGM